jgi:hypothetical protein
MIVSTSAFRSQAHWALDAVLAQLAFSTEPPPQSEYANHEENQVRNTPSPTPFWRRMFCSSLHDEDLYFDAYETFGEDSLAAKNRRKSKGVKIEKAMSATKDKNKDIFALRGGAEGSGGDGSYGDDSFRSCVPDFSDDPSIHEYCEATLIEDHPYYDNKGQSTPYYDEPEEDYYSRSNQQIQQQGQQYGCQQQYREDYAQMAPQRQDDGFSKLPPPPPPTELPLRFLRAGKNDPVEGQRRYEATLAWRKANGIDAILTSAHPNFELIKSHYPHFYHLRGRKGEPVFFERPPKTNLAALRAGGISLKALLHHYAMVTEFQWQCVELDDFARSITVIDLEGIRMTDFVGECVDYVRKCSEFTGQNYPERAGFVLVINVPGWFKMIWNVVKPMVDEVTLLKIRILRGKDEVFRELLEKIPIENIPREYGGKSVPLGQSPEEEFMRNLMQHNNNVANGDYSCGGRHASPPCKFCSWKPVRAY